MTTNNNEDFFLDVDNLGEAEQPKGNDSSELTAQDLVFSGGPKPAKQYEATAKVGSGESLQDVYDRLMKLIFLFDTSGSMGDRIIDDTDLAQWSWDMAAIRTKLAECQAEVDNANAAAAIDDLDELTTGCASMLNGSDEEIKMYILREDLTQFFGVMPLGRQTSKSKMEVVRDLASSEIRKRIMKYNEADIRVLTFEDHPKISNARSEKDLVKACSSMFPGGGTNIFAAVDSALKLCKKAPSPVNLHHLVLVSDGLDYGSIDVEQNLLPTMKSLGVVFDFIFIEGTSGEGDCSGAIRSLERVCLATGGEFVRVKKVKDLAQKFIAAAERKMIAAPADTK